MTREAKAGLARSTYKGSRNRLVAEKPYEFALAFTGGKEVLDIGCGLGYGTRVLSSNAFRVVGIDTDRQAVSWAGRKWRAPNLRFEVMDGTRLAFPQGSFDVVVAAEVIEHVDHPAALVQEVFRVLKPGGVFILTTPNAPLLRRSGRLRDPGDRAEFGAEELKTLLTPFARVDFFGFSRLAYYRPGKRWALLRLFWALRRRFYGVGRRLPPGWQYHIRLFFMGVPKALFYSGFPVQPLSEGGDGQDTLVVVCRKSLA